jgi:hypothetical protein
MNAKDRIVNERASLCALRTWMANSMVGQVPAEHAAALGDLLKYLDVMSEKGPAARGLTVHFLRAIGLLPKSERSRKYGLGNLAGDLKDKLESVSRYSLLRLSALKVKSGKEEGDAVQDPPLTLTARAPRRTARNDSPRSSPSRSSLIGSGEKAVGRGGAHLARRPRPRVRIGWSWGHPYEMVSIS